MAFNISFEFFPPKTPEGLKNLEVIAQALAKANPSFFSVTFGAGGTTREGTLETVKVIREKTQIDVAPHLACIGSTRKDLISILQQYRREGVNRIVALRGDLPSGMGGDSGEVRYASDLVQLIREITQDHFTIEVAAYPEFHPQAKSAHDDVLNLKRKIAAGANSAITQYFFNPDAYFYFLDQCAKENIFIPITPGIMPIIQFSKLKRFSELCGAQIPQWLVHRLEQFGDDTQSIQQFGIEVVHRLCEELIKGGAPGLHFYTLNHSELSLKILDLLKVKQKVKPYAVR